MEQFGPAAGLAAAACWAMASVLYVRVPIGAGAMTTFKNSLAALCVFAALLGHTWYHKLPIFQASTSAWWDIGVSGVIGLCLADIAYFRSIQILGPRRGLALTLLIPPATAWLGQIWLGEELTVITWCCILVTLLGIAVVMRERAERAPEQEIRPGSTQWGVACALMSVATMAIGAVILKRGTAGAGSLEATFIRLLAASGFGMVLSLVLGQLYELRVLLRDRTALRNLCVATFIGTVAGVWLMLVAYKYCRTGIAATLTSTTPLFVIPVVWFVSRERVTLLATGGAVIAFAGVCGLLLNR